MTKIEILRNSLQHREQEILGYQINIDNYRLAIEHIKKSGDAELSEFRSRLEDLLASELLEQKKSKVMFDVVKMQLED